MEEQKNTNCLEGVRCPACGHDDEVLLLAGLWVSLDDNGVDFHADSLKHLQGVEYDEDTLAMCPCCRHSGKFGEWNMSLKEPVSS